MSNKFTKIIVAICVGVAFWAVPLGVSKVQAQVIAAHEETPAFQTVAMGVASEDEDEEADAEDEDAAPPPPADEAAAPPPPPAVEAAAPPPPAAEEAAAPPPPAE